MDDPPGLEKGYGGGGQLSNTQTMTPEQIAKLPKWAQEAFKDLKRQRDVAIRELNEWVDSQTPSPFRVDELVCTGERPGPSSKVRYVQGHRMELHHAGLRLDINAHDDGCINLQWSTLDRRSSDVAFVPTSFCSARLVTKENMR